MSTPLPRVLGRQTLRYASGSTSRVQRTCYQAKWLASRGISSTAPLQQEAIPLRKHLKDEAKRKRAEGKKEHDSNLETDKSQDWELTVGIEVHAQLNTRSKLFSDATADEEGAANGNVAVFDAALPGSQPVFQIAALIPAIRAALALDCDVQHESSWDRKHYFHWDQPNGYQITQYYRPFAKNGRIVLTAEDGVPATDLHGAQSLEIGVKQIQMEQDTAKTTQFSDSTYHIDLNRAGHPLIEIITLPQIHSPQTAAAVVRKLQALLKTVDACTIGMELGGLRADVNVSVRRRGTNGTHGYSGIDGLGQRTEIKNLSSFKAIEDAVIAERNRQIDVLEAGGKIKGETRGWTLGAKSTTRLRGKEGEVDYRYSPDADLPPLLIAQDLVDYLQDTLPELPSIATSRVQQTYGISSKDSRTIISLDDGERLDFLEQTAHLLSAIIHDQPVTKLGKLVGNWVIHELGGVLTTEHRGWSSVTVTPQEMADILTHLLQKKITARSAKLLVTKLDENDNDNRPSVAELIKEHNLLLKPLSESEYAALARQLMHDNPDIVAAVRDRGQKGKAMWFVGQMLRAGEDGAMDPEMAKNAVQKELGI